MKKLKERQEARMKEIKDTNLSFIKVKKAKPIYKIYEERY